MYDILCTASGAAALADQQSALQGPPVPVLDDSNFPALGAAPSPAKGAAGAPAWAGSSQVRGPINCLRRASVDLEVVPSTGHYVGSVWQAERQTRNDGNTANVPLQGSLFSSGLDGRLAGRRMLSYTALGKHEEDPNLYA